MRSDVLTLQAALLVSSSGRDEDVVTFLLRDLGVQVISVPDAVAATDLAQARRFALVLLDLDCDPHWQSTIPNLRMHTGSSPVVVYSRLPDETIWIDALEAGAFDYLCKPFSINEVRWVLQNALKPRCNPPARRPVRSP